MSEKSEGVYRKFTVERTDGGSAPGAKHEGCEYFVLDWAHDPYAVPAALAYADACEREFPNLARDLRSLANRHQSATIRHDAARAEKADARLRCGKGLRRARVSARLSQKALARAVGVTSPYISLMESDERVPSLVVLGRVAAACGLLTSELLRCCEQADVS